MDGKIELLSLLMGYALTALLAYGVIKIVIKYFHWRFTPLRKLPGPKIKSFLFGNFPEIRKEPFMGPHKRWWKDAGYDTKLMHYSSMLGQSSILVLDKEIAKEILTAPAGRKDSRFSKNFFFLRNILGDGLVTLEGEDWMRHRRIIQPSFSSSFLKDKLNKTIPSKSNELVEYWRKSQGREIDVASHLSAVTLDVIGDVAFAHKFHGMKEIKKWTEDEGSDKLAELQDPFISSILHSLKPNLLAIFISLTGFPSLDNQLNPVSRKRARMLNKAVDDVVKHATKSSGKDNSFLQLLLRAEDTDPASSLTARTLNHAELRDETKTFLLAGHETTSTWCYWALFALSKFPEVQEKVFADVLKHSKGQAEITLDMVDEMKYFHAFLQEVLRMYPPVGMIPRVMSENDSLGGFEVPKRTRIVIAVHLLHRHPKYWDEPETFKPERWLDGSVDEDRIRFAFLPFSAGGRNCIGQRFATIEAKLILAPLIRSFRFQVAPSQRDTEFTFTSFVTVKSKPALKIVAQSRT